MKYWVLLTIDLEEFVLPLDFNKNISIDEALKISFNGYKNLARLIKELKINITLFVSSRFAIAYPRAVRKLLKEGNEIAIHAVPKNLEYIKKEKEIIEEIIDNKTYGFRSHKLTLPDFKILKKLGFNYDSSLHPTYVPGRFNHLTAPTKIFISDNIKEIPISVLPILRLPFSFVWFRNLGLTYSKLCTMLTLKQSSFINMYFHPWEFANIKNFDLPFYVKGNTGETLYHMLSDYLHWCLENNMKIGTIRDFLSI